MNSAYVAISGTVFGAVAVLHFIRVVNQWPFVIGPWSLPLWVSWLGTIVPLVLCLWAFRLAPWDRS
jgi:hypothetical protein